MGLTWPRRRTSATQDLHWFDDCRVRLQTTAALRLGKTSNSRCKNKCFWLTLTVPWAHEWAHRKVKSSLKKYSEGHLVCRICTEWMTVMFCCKWHWRWILRCEEISKANEKKTTLILYNSGLWLLREAMDSCQVGINLDQLKGLGDTNREWHENGITTIA